LQKKRFQQNKNNIKIQHSTFYIYRISLMKISKADILRKKVLNKIKKIDLADYLVEELEALLGYLHYYKLRNVFKNSKSLTEYLLLLDEQNSTQIKKICEGISIRGRESHPKEQVYFLSNTGLEQVGEKKIDAFLTRHGSNSYQLQNIILGLKGMLLLSANEFCHASSTRMSINKTLRKRQRNKR